MNDKIQKAIDARFVAPPHIAACAAAIRYDLYHGPTWSIIPGGDIEKFDRDCFATYPDDFEPKDGDIVEETYIGKVADALRDFIDALPSEVFFDEDCEELLEKEPEPYQDDDGEWIDPFEWNNIYRVERRDIVASLFGKMLSREFN